MTMMWAHCRAVLLAASLRCASSLVAPSPRPAPRTAVSAGGAWDLELFSPAKVNLFLRILRKRDDGFHDLASLFQAVDLGDTLAFEVLGDGAKADALECDAPGCPLDASNLVLRAIALLRARLEHRAAVPFLRVRLDKRTPIQAGLGGGSSNAATALYAANELAGRPASESELVEWSGELGSDITFFRGPTGSCYCTGRGEVLEPVDALPARDLVVVKPAVGLSTPLVFKTLAASGYATLRDDADPRALLGAFAAPGEASPASYVNDLEPPAFECEPCLAALKAKLLDAPENFSAAMMSGSGTSVFAVARPGLDGAAFKRRFEAEAKADLGLDVQVWKTAFAAREPGGWYAHP